MKHLRIIVIVVVLALALQPLASKAAYAIPTAGLIGYWPGNGSAIDLSPVGNNGSGGSYSSGAPTGGNAFNLASKVTIANNSAYNFKSYAGYTIGFWFNPNGTSLVNNGTFLGQDNGSGYQPKWFIDYGYTVWGPNNDYVFHVNDYNQERIFITSPSEPLPSVWTQLTVTVNNEANGTVTFYLNGQAIGSGQLGAGYVLETSASLVFGQAEGLSYGGLMSDVVIYDRVLSPSEVQQLATVPANTSFSITSESLDGQGNVVITWESTPGAVYQVVGATNLVPVISWTNVGNPVLATGTNTSATIPITSSANFFSVKTP